MGQGNSGIGQHKRMAMGEKVTGMKSGGHAKHSDEAEDRRMIKSMVKSEALTGKALGGAVIGRPRVTSITPRVPASDRLVTRPAPRLVRAGTRPSPVLMKKGGATKEKAEHETKAEQRAEGKAGECSEMKRGGAAKRCMKCGGLAHGGRCK